jgi:hypothetical protein
VGRSAPLDARSGRGAFEMLARADSSHLVCALLQLRALGRIIDALVPAASADNRKRAGLIWDTEDLWVSVVVASAASWLSQFDSKCDSHEMRERVTTRDCRLGLLLILAKTRAL